MPNFRSMWQYHLGVAAEDPQFVSSGENGKSLYRFRVLTPSPDMFTLRRV